MSQDSGAIVLRMLIKDLNLERERVSDGLIGRGADNEYSISVKHIQGQLEGLTTAITFCRDALGE